MTKEFLNSYKALINNLEYMKEYGTGIISIGLIEAVKNWIPEIINVHHQTYNNQRFELHEVLTLQEIKNVLKSNNLHLCISNHQIDDENIQCDLLYEEEFVLICKKGYFGENKDSISMSEVSKEPLIITPNKLQTHQDILTAFKNGGAKPNIKYEVERFDTACSLVEAGLGVSILPKSYMQTSNAQYLDQVNIEEYPPKRKVYLLYNKNQIAIKSVKHFIDLCVSQSEMLEL